MWFVYTVFSCVYVYTRKYVRVVSDVYVVRVFLTYIWIYVYNSNNGKSENRDDDNDFYLSHQSGSLLPTLLAELLYDELL